MKTLRITLSFLLFIYVSSVSAHSVQVQYCVSCNGDLRIWVEHWHGAANPGSTNMTISLDVNGTTTQQTSSPGGGVQNMAPGNLPGCSTPITFAAGCPGSQNTYNDWVYYDFNGIPQGVPITFTIISGNTVFTQDACGMFPLAVTFTIQGVGQVDNQDACTGQVSSSVNLPGNSTWTNDNPAIGIPASGSGPINSFNPIGPVGTTANISYQSGCGSGVFTYTIQPAPVPQSSASSGGVNSTESCLGTPFNFTDNSTVPAPYVINGWLWDFGDGNTDTTQNPTYTYAATGNYTVTFTALSDIGCGGSTTFPVVVNEVPVAIFSSDVVCEGTATTFTNASTIVNSNITIWNWDILNDGSLNYVTENPTHTFPAGGTYDVALTVVSTDGCPSPVTVNTVTVDSNPIASFTSDIVCANTPTTLTDASTVANSTITTWNWDILNDNSIEYNTQNPTNTFASGGTYTVGLTVQSATGCPSQLFTTTVDVNYLPVAIFTSDSVCLGFPTTLTDASTITNSTISTWNWDFGDGTTNSGVPMTYTYPTIGDFSTQLDLITAQGCVGSVINNVYVHSNPTADFSTDSVCANTPTTFTDLSSVINSSIATWDWDILNDNSIEYTSQSPTNTFLTGGTYNVSLTVSSSAGCISPLVVYPVIVDYIPVPNFTSDSVCVGDITTLTDASAVTNSTISTWNMSFGDGNSGFSSPAPNVYPLSGDYTAQLLVISAEGCTDTIDGNVYVRALPVADFSISDACFYETITTNNNSNIDAGTMSYGWDFGDGTGLDFNTSPSHDYLSAGVYNVNLTTTSNFGCIHDTTLSVNVYDKPIADYSVAGTCLNQNSFFFDNSSITNIINSDLIDSWEWDMDGDLVSNYSTQNPFHSYQAEGGHNTQLIVTTAFGCKDTLTLPVEVWPLPSVDFDFIDLCLNDLTQFSDLSNVSNVFTTNSLDVFDWDLGDGTISNLQNPTHTYPAYGDYNVSLNITSNNGCESSISQIVNIRPLPFPNFTSTEICVNTPPTQFTDNTVIPVGNTTQWLWNFGDGNTSNSQNPSNTYSLSGTYQVQLTATSAFGCVNDTTLSAIVHEKPTASFTSDVVIACNPSDILFTDLSTSPTSSIIGWEWSFGNGSTSIGQNPNINFVNQNSEPEFFDVELITTNNLGCKDTLYVNNYIQIIPTPEASFTYSPSVLTLTDSETNFTNQSINSDEYEWDFGYNTPTSGSENPTHLFPNDQPRSYEVQLIAYNYGQMCTDTAWATVVVQDIILFYVPNAFTPDNDIFNQVWHPVFVSGYDPYDFHLILFNRWGETVWESYDASAGWNGHYSGRNELVEDGVYVWTIEFKETMSDKRHKHTGFVTILK